VIVVSLRELDTQSDVCFLVERGTDNAQRGGREQRKHPALNCVIGFRDVCYMANQCVPISLCDYRRPNDVRFLSVAVLKDSSSRH
jgi:hypothetical protein